MKSSAISIKNVSKDFVDQSGTKLAVLRQISLEIPTGEVSMILGTSGSGKSTLLRIIAGLENDYQGSVKFARGITGSDISFVFQQFALLPWLTVEDNVGLGLRARHLSPTVYRKRVQAELERLKLRDFAKSYPHELSGGMRQRVGIARALATQPKILLMDEPFSELDSFTAEALRQELLEIWQEKRITIVMVTHNIQEALELGSQIAVITPIPATIEALIANKLARPRKKRSVAFYRLEDRIIDLIKQP